MKRRKFIGHTAMGAAAFPNLILAGCAMRKRYDILIVGGIVFDGSGGKGQEADVAVAGDRIVKIGQKLDRKSAREVIEAKGMVISPGFIDPHTHTDVQLLANPKAESKIHQGVTTEIGGNCGFSYFPLSDRAYEEAREKVQKTYGVDVDWRDIGGFFGRLEKSGFALNFATLLGQGALRDVVLGPYDRPPTPAETERMKTLVRENMEAGAIGLSTGLEYIPGCFAKQDELTELCREVARLGGVYATHMRNENDEVLKAVEETLATARDSKVSLQISHIKANYPRNWAKIDGMLAAIDQAAKEGVRVSADRYPYIAFSSGLDYFFPEWAREGTRKDFINRLRDASLQAKIRAHLKEREKMLGSWDRVLISSILSEKNRALVGSTVLAAASSQKKPPYEFMRDLLIEENGIVDMVGFGMCEENLKKFYAHPLVTAGSDGSAVAPYGILGNGKPHPRFYGTFPRYLARYVLDQKVLPLEEAIRRITSFTAEKFGLAERGRLAEGYFADVTVLDLNRIMDRATFENPHQYPDGVVHVLVNGKVVVRNGEHTGALPGKILKREARKA